MKNFLKNNFSRNDLPILPICAAFRNTILLTVLPATVIVVIGEVAADPIVFNENKLSNAMHSRHIQGGGFHVHEAAR